MAFSEEVAWVTGSSTGIGRAVAVALAGQGRILGYCGISPGIRGGLIDVVPGAEDGDGRLRATLPELGDQVGPISVRERKVEHRHVERLVAP